MRILFMGTPEFAVPTLRAICEAGHEVVGVIAQPDRPSGRGYKLTPPPVKVEAEARDLPVYQPESMRTPEAAELVAGLAPDVAVVVAYGQILPRRVLAIPDKGCINVHASLLPKYRGAAPIQWAMIHGDRETGVTTMYMDVGMDTGDMILKRATPIRDDDTAEGLWDRLSHMGAELLVETLDLIAEGRAPRTPQNSDEATLAPRLTKADGLICFDQSAGAILNRIRGVTPWPGAHCPLGEQTLKVHAAAPAEGSGIPGAILENKRLVVATADGAVELIKVQLPGKAAQSGAQLMQGRRLKAGDLLK